MIQAIKGIPPPYPFEGPDRISWSHTSSGASSVKSAYKAIKKGDWNPEDEKWKIAWRFPGPQQIRIFIWTILQGRVLSNVERVRKGLSDDPSCLICGFQLEDILHILRDCKPWSSNKVVQGSYSWAIHFFSSSQEVSFGCLDHSVEVHTSEERVYLYTDGAVQLDSGLAAAEGVVHDKEGHWIFGFHQFLGKCTVFNAEL
ncbi:hypothetical protein PVK06_030951 [Gossypium arboreum]|uniref:Reverse transcriptase zinc-binding domain-containing protein n=1 Tax=Gossypium arboreum TaxID=29729 RepID=A0ABR0NQP8_GOSAR|nr:hypothetical protein PVK06_030951 [Gossypium arboreum]